MTPVVSVIMNCHNGAAFLRLALDSVFAQTFTDFEIVFWDNHSSDGSGEIAKTYGSKLQYFRGSEFLPLGAARNEAIAVARGKYIAWLDCDDLWDPGKLEIQVQRMENSPEVSFSYSNFYFFDSDTQKKKRILQGNQPEGNVFEKFLFHYPVGMLTVMMRRDAILTMSAICDPDLHLAVDYDLFLRFLYGKKALYIDQPLASYRVHTQMRSLQQRNRWPEEMTRIREKLMVLTASEAEKYAAAFEHLRRYVEFVRGKVLMVDGRLRDARPHLLEASVLGFKYRLLYFATFLPPAVWLNLKPFWARGTFR